MITIDQITELLGCPLAPEIARHWEESIHTLPPDGPQWLDEDGLAADARYAGFEEKTIVEIVSAAKRINEHPALRTLAWHLHRMAFHAEDTTPALFKSLPKFEPAAGCLWGQFYLLVGLTSTELARKKAALAGVDEQIVRETMKDVSLQSERFRLVHNYYGLFPEALNWLRHHALGEIYRLGRLQFMVKPFGLNYRIYRHRKAGCAVALAGDSIHFDANGFICVPDANTSHWTSTFNSFGGWIEGFPILPEGHAEQRMIRLAESDWECRVEKNSPVLEMHIPAGGGMTLIACQESMRQALTFFPEHFPERKFAAFACKSWVFNTQLQEVLPPTANLVQFQREVYLLPTMSDGKAGLNFIFGTKDVNLSTAARQTSIQRALLEILESGQALRSGGMIFFPEDIDHIGSQFYRMRWNEALANCVGVQV